jgi:hypothetical protein
MDSFKKRNVSEGGIRNYNPSIMSLDSCHSTISFSRIKSLRKFKSSHHIQMFGYILKIAALL